MEHPEPKNKSEKKALLKLKRIIPVILLFAIFIAIQGPGCFRKQVGPDQAAVPQGCAACHERLADITGADHPEIAMGGIQNCRACHVTDGDASALSGIIHREHFSKSDFSGDCWSCHYLDDTGGFNNIGDGKKIAVTKDAVDRMMPYFRTWADSTFLDHTHAGADIDCAGCHNTFFPNSGLSLEDCLKCHGSYEDLSGTTREVEPNPHDSHYMDLRCTLCHKGHGDSVLYCNTCHEFDLEVP